MKVALYTFVCDWKMDGSAHGWSLFCYHVAAIDTAYEESQMTIDEEGRAMLDQMLGGSGADELMRNKLVTWSDKPMLL
jgi:hypothetical protein